MILILICLLPINALAVTYGKVGESTNFNGDVGVPTGKGYYINGVQITSGALSDVASIAMLDESETVTATWTFNDYFYINRSTDTASNAPSFYFSRIRDGDPTTSVSSGDYLGRIAFSGFNAVYDDYMQGAQIRTIVDGTPGNEDMPGRLEFLTTPDGSDIPVLRMAIDNAGNHKMGDGVWTNYIQITAAGILTPEGSATVKATNLVPTVEIDMGAHTVGFTMHTATGDGATLINWTAGNKHKFTFGSQNETITFTNPTNPCAVQMIIVQDGTGSRTITWSGMTIKWHGGTAPTLTTTASGEDIISFIWDGTSYYGQCSKAFATP